MFFGAETKRFNGKSCYPLPLLLSLKFFDTAKIPNSLTKKFRYCDKKQFRWRIVIGASVVLSKEFFDTRKILKLKKILLRSFGTMRQQIFDGKRSTPFFPPPLLIHKFSRYREFPETQKGPYTNFLSTVCHKRFDGES